MFWGALLLCHLGVRGGAVVNAIQRCPGAHCPSAALVGWLGLMWLQVWGSLTQQVSQGTWTMHWSMLSRGNVNHIHQTLLPRECSRSSPSLWWSSSDVSYARRNVKLHLFKEKRKGGKGGKEKKIEIKGKNKYKKAFFFLNLIPPLHAQVQLGLVWACSSRACCG